jgi:hypothetical protein
MGQRLASSRRPLRWPLSRPAIDVRWALHRGNLSCFADPSSRSHLAPIGSGRPTVSVCEGSSRPHYIRHTQRQTIRERDTEGTASSFGDVPAHTPHAVPGSLQSRQRNQALPRDLWVGLRVDSRGGSDAPRGRKRRRKSGRRLSPAGTSLPPRRSSQLESGPARPRARETSVHAADCDCARSDSNRTGVLGRVKVSRASRAAATTKCRDLDSACARPRDGSCRSEQKLTDVTTSRTRGRL